MTIMFFQPRPERPEEEDNLEAALLDQAARQVKQRASQATQGRAERFEQLAARFAHLGSVSDELLTLALEDVEATPAYFEAVLRFALAPPAKPEPSSAEPTVMIGTVAASPAVEEETNDEQ